jgi:hypothetical protein
VFLPALPPHQGFLASVNFTAASGAFPAGFTPKSGTVTFPAGQTSQSVPFTWDCDSTDNDDRVVTIALSNPTSPLTVSATNGAATLTVQDDDAVRLPVGREKGVPPRKERRLQGFATVRVQAGAPLENIAGGALIPPGSTPLTIRPPVCHLYRSPRASP